jgi:hypothetical protein
MTRFGINTIPALVLLDRNGRVVCWDGRRRIASAPMGWSTAISVSLPPDPRLEPMLIEKPNGYPPTFVRGLPAGVANPVNLATGQTTGGPLSCPTGGPRRRCPANRANVPPVAGSDISPLPPTKQVKSWPPPETNLKSGKGAITFSLPPSQLSLGSHARNSII